MSDFDPAVTLAEIGQFVDRLVELSCDGREAFMRSWRDQEAAQMLITKLAEAVARLPATAVASWGDVPWHQIRGMRNRVVHAYHAVDLEVLWETVADDALQLRVLLGRIGSSPDSVS